MSQTLITPFTVKVAADDITDLRSRLKRTRWTDWLPDAGWSFGTDESYLKQLCAYWQDGYDFQGYEARLNAWPQFMAESRGEQMQF